MALPDTISLREFDTGDGKPWKLATEDGELIRTSKGVPLGWRAPETAHRFIEGAGYVRSATPELWDRA